MNDTPCTITSHDIAAEFFAQTRALDDAQRAWLLAREIPPAALNNGSDADLMHFSISLR